MGQGVCVCAQSLRQCVPVEARYDAAVGCDVVGQWLKSSSTSACGTTFSRRVRVWLGHWWVMSNRRSGAA